MHSKTRRVERSRLNGQQGLVELMLCYFVVAICFYKFDAYWRCLCGLEAMCISLLVC